MNKENAPTVIRQKEVTLPLLGKIRAGEWIYFPSRDESSSRARKGRFLGSVILENGFRSLAVSCNQQVLNVPCADVCLLAQVAAVKAANLNLKQLKKERLDRWEKALERKVPCRK